MLGINWNQVDQHTEVRVTLDDDSVVSFDSNHPKWAEVKQALSDGNQDALVAIDDWSKNGPDSDVREKCEELGYRWFFDSDEIGRITADRSKWGIAHADTINGHAHINDTVYETWEACWEENEPVELEDSGFDAFVDVADPQPEPVSPPTGLWQRVRKLFSRR